MLRKKVTNYLFVTREMITFAAENDKNVERMINLNLLSGLIIIRLQRAGGSDKACR